VAQEHGSAAERRLHERRQCVESLAFGRPTFGVDFLLDALASASEILRTQNSQASAGSPSRPARPVSW